MQHLRTSTRQRYSYTERLIANHMRPTEQHQYQYPWVTWKVTLAVWIHQHTVEFYHTYATARWWQYIGALYTINKHWILTRVVTKPNSITFPVNHTTFPDLHWNMLQYQKHTIICNTITKLSRHANFTISKDFVPGFLTFFFIHTLHVPF